MPALALAAAVILTGCVAPDPGQDPVVIRAEQATKGTFDLFDQFLRWEDSNRAVVPTEVHKFADRLRDEGPAAIRTVRSATKTYKITRHAADKDALAAAIKALEALKEEVYRWFPEEAKAKTFLGAAAPAPAVVIAAIDGLSKLMVLLQGWIAEAKRRKEWTPEEEAQIDAQMEEAFKQAHWQKKD